MCGYYDRADIYYTLALSSFIFSAVNLFCVIFFVFFHTFAFVSDLVLFYFVLRCLIFGSMSAAPRCECLSLMATKKLLIVGAGTINFV